MNSGPPLVRLLLSEIAKFTRTCLCHGLPLHFDFIFLAHNASFAQQIQVLMNLYFCHRGLQTFSPQLVIRLR